MDRIPAFHRHTRSLQDLPTSDGVIRSFTTIHNPPHGFGSDSYIVALIEHDDGTKCMAQLTRESAPPMIGARVKPVLRTIRTMDNGLIMHDRKYRVLASQEFSTFDIKHYILAVSGPSGVGKTTIARQIFSLFSGITEQVPIYTTRTKRSGDVEPYQHISKEQFDRMVASHEIVSYTSMPSATEVRFYGYRKTDIEAIWKRGKLPVVVTELNLLQGLVNTFGRRSVLSFGLLPPGKSKRSRLSTLLNRLRLRGNQTEEQIAERLKVAELDLNHFDVHPHLFDHMLVNDELDLCVQKISTIAKIG
jgi:guanylate kinase